MNEAEKILLFVLGAFLAIFLICAIWVAIEVIKLVKGARRVVVKAESIVDSAESITEVFQNISGPMAAFKVLRNIMKFVNKRKG